MAAAWCVLIRMARHSATRSVSSCCPSSFFVTAFPTFEASCQGILRTPTPTPHFNSFGHLGLFHDCGEVQSPDCRSLAPVRRGCRFLFCVDRWGPMAVVVAVLGVMLEVVLVLDLLVQFILWFVNNVSL